MLFLWATVGTYTHIFESENNSQVSSFFLFYPRSQHAVNLCGAPYWND